VGIGGARGGWEGEGEGRGRERRRGSETDEWGAAAEASRNASTVSTRNLSGVPRVVPGLTRPTHPRGACAGAPSRIAARLDPFGAAGCCRRVPPAVDRGG
jgi:hypothetical protein